MRTFTQIALGLLTSAALVAGGTAAQAAPLNLIVPWNGAPFGTSPASVTLNGSIVQFKGAIANGTSGAVFRLKSTFRPATDVYIPLDLCNATNGRLHIMPDGNADVQWETAFSDAQCFTSLDGASFAPSATGFTPLPLLNGWFNAPFATSNAAFLNAKNVLHFKGAIGTAGTNMAPFVLPKGNRPPATAYVHIDLCNSTNGRLHITHAGVVTVEVEGGAIANAQCFTSLDGASFATSANGFTPLTLVNGWVGAPFGTSQPAAKVIGPTVVLMGAMATTTSNSIAFTLPVGMRPAANVYVPVDMCNATKGRLFIQANGTVSVQAKTSFANAQCFTSLDGVSFQL